MKPRNFPRGSKGTTYDRNRESACAHADKDFYYYLHLTTWRMCYPAA